MNKIKKYFLKRIRELKIYCKDGSPWVFLNASVLLEYLSKITYGKDAKAKGYKKFIRDFLSRVNPKYKDFRFYNGEKDLPEQMYHVLRSGIVHSFSLIPNSFGVSRGARLRSVVLCHQKEANKNHLKHLQNYKSKRVSDAALFVAEQFIDDLRNITEIIFKIARTNSKQAQCIRKWVRQHPPIQGGF